MAQLFDRRSRGAFAELERVKTEILAAEDSTRTSGKLDATAEPQQPQDDSEESELVKTE